MKKLFISAILALSSIVTFNVQADEGMNCHDLAYVYAKNAKAYNVLAGKIFLVVNSNKNSEELVDSITILSGKLSDTLKQVKADNCDLGTFVREQAETRFGFPALTEYRKAFLPEGKLDIGAYCDSIKQAYNSAQVRSAIFGITSVQVRAFLDPDIRAQVDILFKEGKIKTLGDIFGVPSLFSDSGIVTLEMLKGMSNEELMLVSDKAYKLMNIYWAIEDLQDVRLQTFCPVK